MRKEVLISCCSKITSRSHLGCYRYSTSRTKASSSTVALKSQLPASSNNTIINNPKQPPVINNNINNTQLCVSGGAYLVPTLRLGRKDTPHSIDYSLEQVLLDTNPATTTTATSTIKSMLQGRQQQQPAAQCKWMVPITLDLTELLPDGSPHYSTPPSLATVQEYITVLNKYNVAVVGIVHVQRGPQPEPNVVEHLAAMLGIPTLLPISRRINRSAATTSTTTAVTNATIPLHDLARLITSSIVTSNTNTITSISQSSTSPSFPPDKQEAYITHKAKERHAIQQTLQSKILQHLQSQQNSNEIENDRILDKKDLDNQQRNLIQEPQNQNSVGTSGASSSKVVHGHVRSGQIVSSDLPHQSLVIIGDVHSGGEVLSDGDIHIYGKLKGRAIAGVLSSEARIYVQSFDPELVCIQGTYTTIDNVTQLPCSGNSNNKNNNISTNNNDITSPMVATSTPSNYLKPGDAVIVSLDSTKKQLQFQRM